MNISQPRRKAARITPSTKRTGGNLPDDDQEVADSTLVEEERDCVVLVLPELEIWDYVGNQPIKDRTRILDAMDTICAAAQAILKGKPRQRYVRRVEGLAGQSTDERHQKFIQAIVAALREGDKEGLDAVLNTAILIDNVVDEPPWYDPEDIGKPWYPKRRVWRPGGERASTRSQQRG
ncbi:MAG TPA: hypothetical protein VJH03_12995 [Blastocatellia bacterium]|nr:hypothetical protein [Blastocatellia bacterium]